MWMWSGMENTWRFFHASIWPDVTGFDWLYWTSYGKTHIVSVFPYEFDDVDIESFGTWTLCYILCKWEFYPVSSKRFQLRKFCSEIHFVMEFIEWTKKQTIYVTSWVFMCIFSMPGPLKLLKQISHCGCFLQFAF